MVSLRPAPSAIGYNGRNKYTLARQKSKIIVEIDGGNYQKVWPSGNRYIPNHANFTFGVDLSNKWLERNFKLFNLFQIGWKDIRQAGSKKDPRSIDRANFERAGTSPLTRTYKYDPTKIKRETS